MYYRLDKGGVPMMWSLGEVLLTNNMAPTFVYQHTAQGRHNPIECNLTYKRQQS